MTVNMSSLRNKRRQPNTLSIKKHSDIMRNSSINIVVGGLREKTPTGFIVKGFRGKTFETYFETMLPGTSSVTLFHEKKDKTIRVLSGIMYVITKEGETVQQRKVIPGDEVILNRGVTHRLATSKETVEFFVCQGAKYASAVVVVDEDSLVTKQVLDSLLVEPTTIQRLAQSHPHEIANRRVGSKAKEQLEAQRAGRKSAQILDEPMPAESNFAFGGGVNPKPTGGAFGEEGAG